MIPETERKKKQKRTLNTRKGREKGRLSLNYKYFKEKIDQWTEVTIVRKWKRPLTLVTFIYFGQSTYIHPGNANEKNTT